MRSSTKLSLIATLLTAVVLPAAAQTYLNAGGNPTFGVDYPIENGFLNVANGNLHIEIPLSSYKQRGKQEINERLIYDSRIWAINDNGSRFWSPDNSPAAIGGWRTQGGQEGGLDEIGYLVTEYPGCYHYSNFSLIDSSGTGHYFPFMTNACTSQSASGYAVDGSGFYAEVTNGNTVTVYDNQGDQVYLNQMDSNGNYSTVDANYNLIDTDGRTPVLATTDGDTTYYDVLTVGGSRIRYTVTTTTVYYNTQFNQSAVSESSGSFQAIQSIQLPDNTAYTFTYDSGTSSGHYGELTDLTLPTGGTIHYSYLLFEDSYQNVNRWVASRQDQFGTAAFTPTVINACSQNGTGCEEEMRVTKPSGDAVNHTLTLNNGAWNTQTDYYTANYAGGASPVMTTVTGYDFNNHCDPSICLGAEYVQASSKTTTLNDAGKTAQTLYTFAQPWTGKPTKIQQWDYYPAGQQAPGTPTQETDFTYNETVNGAALPTLIQRLDQNGNPYTSTTINYDETAPVATSGIVNHQAVTGNRGNVTSVLNGIPGGAQSKSIYAYNDTGAVLSATDPNGNTTSYGYDSTDTYVTRMTRPTVGGAQHVSTAQYDASTGFPTQSVDENKQTTTIAYDSLGRMQQIDDPDGGSVGYSYPEPEIETIATRAISPAVSMTQTTFNDGLGRPSRVTSSDPGGNSTVSYSYDGNGRVASVTTPERSTGSGTDGTESFAYDWLDRYTSITRPDGNTVRSSYSGNTATITDENGNSKEYQYDAFTNLSAVFEPDTNGVLDWETAYIHDAANHLTSITQEGNADPSQWRVRSFVYDDLGRLIGETTPETGTSSYGYDSNGNMRSLATPAYSVNLTYDALNRMLTKTSSGIAPSESGSVNDTYSYDNAQPACHAIGRLTTATTASLGGGTQMAAKKPGGASPLIVLQPKNSTSYCYDTMGRLSQETWSFQNRIYKVSAAYDYAGDVAQLTYPDGRAVAQTYQSDDRLYNVQYSAWNGQSESASYFAPSSYAPTGQMTGAAFGNGVQLAAGYNNRSSLTGLSYSTTAGALWSKAYQWAANAINLQTVTDATGAVTPVQFSYDPLNRIAGVAGGGPVGGGGGGVSETYTVDAWGNLQQAGNFNLNAAYTTANQLPTSDGYAYDTAGDLISDGNGNSFAYDTDGHLILSNGADAYNYGADGHMVYSVTAAGETDNIYLGDLLVGKYQPGTASWTDMIYGGGNLVATVGGTQTAVPDYRLTDHLGSLAVLTDSSGNVLESNVFVPYGEQLSGNTLDPFLYTGLEREPDTGTDRALYRQYDSGQRRWLTPDLYHGSYDMNDPQSFNRYAYVRNSPTFYTDPSGLNEGGCLICTIGIDIGVEVGAILGLDELFGIGGPSFHGSMQPRPSTNDPGSFGESLGIPTGLSIPNPGVVGALGLPTGDECEFGACSPGPSYATGNVGVSGSYTLPFGLSFTFFAGIVFDTHGHLGAYAGSGGGVAVGASGSGGVQVGFSNGNSICAFGGPFANYSGTAGAEAAGTADYFEGSGDAPGGRVRGGGITFGVGGGGSASAATTVTQIGPFAGHKCVNGILQ